jgi:uncharacterized membrane protein
MKRLLPTALAAALALAAAGCPKIVTIDEYPCPPGGTTLTYENFGAAFFAENCNGCHSADDANREGAPSNYVFDTQAAIQADAALIFARAAASNDAMPPGPDMIPDQERDDLADWLACGAP